MQAVAMWKGDGFPKTEPASVPGNYAVRALLRGPVAGGVAVQTTRLRLAGRQ